MNQILSLSAESFVEAKQLTNFKKELLSMKKRQGEIAEKLQQLEKEIKKEKGSKEILELLETTKQLHHCYQQKLTENIIEIGEHSNRSENLSNKLYQTSMYCKMRPLAEGLLNLPRLIRNLSRELNKKAKLSIVGESVMVDREILEKLKIPLEHLVNNALNHGIESSKKRKAEGKKESGTITIEARQEGEKLVIEVKDDGAGIDIKKLKKELLEKKIFSFQEIEKIEKEKLLEMLFLPGVSTEKKASTRSGRGIGLDIVKNMIEEIDGRLYITTKKGKGTMFTMEITLSKSIMPLLITEIAGGYYGFPISSVKGVLTVRKNAIEEKEGKLFLPIEGKKVSLVYAYNLLELKKPLFEDDDLPILLIRHQSKHYGIIVTSFLGEEELVVRELDERLGKIEHITASAILEDGTPLLICSVEEFLKTLLVNHKGV